MFKSKTLPKIGVDEFWFAPLTKDEQDSQPEYAESVKVPGLVNVGFNPNAQTGTYNADNVPYAVAVQTGNLELSVGLADIPPELRAVWFAQAYENGILEEGQINPIDMGVAYRVKKSSGAYRYVWVFKAKAAPPSESTETQGTSVNFQSDSITINGSMLVSTGKSRRILDDDDPNLPEGVTPKVIEENWFTDPLWQSEALV